MLNLNECTQWHSIAVYVKIQNFKFHYLSKLKNIFITLWQICSGHYIPNFIKISGILQEIWQKYTGVFPFTA